MKIPFVNQLFFNPDKIDWSSVHKKLHKLESFDQYGIKIEVQCLAKPNYGKQ